MNRNSFHIKYDNVIAPPHIDTGNGRVWANGVYEDTEGRGIKFGYKVAIKGVDGQDDIREVIGLYWKGMNPIELRSTSGEISWSKGEDLRIVEEW